MTPVIAYQIGNYAVTKRDMVVFLTILSLLNYIVILILDNGFALKDHFTLIGAPQRFHEQKFWQYFLPQQEINGSWSTATYVFATLIQQHLHPAIVYSVSNNILILVAFIISLKLFRSIAFSSTASFLFLFSPISYHIHGMYGLTMFPILICYLIIFSYFFIRTVTQFSYTNLLFFIVSLFVFALAYESWLNAAAIIFLTALPVRYILRKNELFREVSVFYLLVFILLCTVIVYLMIKMSIGFYFGQGRESELWLYYKSFPAILSDFPGKVITYFYAALSLVLPPDLTGSSALYRYGPEWILNQQNYYHQQMQFLTYMNHIFLWRYYAGIAFALALVALWKTWRGLLQVIGWRQWLAFFCLVMLLFGSSAYSIIKYRPMHSMPFLAYQAWVNFLGVVGLFALAADWLSRRAWKLKPVYSIAAFWTYIVYTGLAVRTALGMQAINLNMGNYPDPIGRLWSLIARLL